VRRSREKWSESAILKILSPVRLPFRHTGKVLEDMMEPVISKSTLGFLAENTRSRQASRKGHGGRLARETIRSKTAKPSTAMAALF